jgi:hypothetical protein
LNFLGNFRKIGDAEIAPIAGLVQQLTVEDWTVEDTRQKRYEVHQDTQFIGLVYDEDFRHMNATKRPIMDVFQPVLHPVFAQIAQYYESAPDIYVKFGKPVQGYFVRVSLVNLVPGGEIAEHRDKNFSLAHSHRIHIPIVTNEDVLFNVNGEVIHMKAGEMYEINNRRNHSVFNKGSEGRVHLILDWVFPWEPCCCSYKTHPDIPCSPDACIETDRLRTPCNCFPEDQAVDA